MVDHAISAYFPLNPYAEKRKMAILSTFEEKFADRDDIIYTVDFYEYDEEDYQNSWKKYLFPEKVSEKFVVALSISSLSYITFISTTFILHSL